MRLAQDQWGREYYVEPTKADSNMRHGLNSRTSTVIEDRARVIRQRLEDIYPGISDMALPTVELYCRAEARALIVNEYILEVCLEEREVKGSKYIKSGSTGVEAVPAHLWAAADRAEANAAKFAQDLGLDLTGRAKIMKDAALSKHFGLSGESSLKGLVQEGQRLRELRKGS